MRSSGRHFRSIAEAAAPRRTERGAAALLLVACLVLPAHAAASEIRRAAVADDLLATEVDGALYLEVLAAEGDASEGLAARYAAAGRKDASAIRGANEGAEPVVGSFYRIPFEVLLNERRRQVLSALYPEEIPRSPLTFGSDGKGKFAVYHLKTGEALYSAVVVRFCGRVDPAEVNALAGKIAARSGIEDVKRIPADAPIKIPLDLLTAEFLPEGAPARTEVESTLAAAARHRLRAPAARLEGVHVILDAGHGGDDSGAVVGGVEEHQYVYDVMCRVRDLLVRRTAAQVVTTIRDRSTGYIPVDGRLSRDRDEYLLTDPPYDLRSPGVARTGVNLRWRLANEEFGRLLAQGVPAERVVFISLHADSLHPSIRGTMVYVPGRDRRRKRVPGLTAADVERSEGLSRALARELVRSLREGDVTVQGYLPIRDRVIRSGREWIPAVLRASKVPHSLLVEILNLNNAQDRELVVSTEFRQRVAEEIVAALTKYYSGGRDASRPVMARRGDHASPP